MSDVLKEICLRSLNDVWQRQQSISLEVMKQAAQEAQQSQPVRGFVSALKAAKLQQRLPLIAEIKKASPSAGLIRPNFRPASLAEAYSEAGAACLSVLTDVPYFQGAQAYLEQARKACALPLLRKDFMVDAYQIYEARAMGADAILLIVAALGDAHLEAFEQLAFSLGMDVLLEVHNQDELERALNLKSPLIGINNRNLKTMTTSLQTFVTLAAQVPDDRILVAESGLKTHQDLLHLQEHGAAAYLIGESLMRHDDVKRATQDILGLS